MTLEPLPAQTLDSDPLRIMARRDGDRMMRLIAQWDTLRYSEKLREVERYEQGEHSRFSEVPGFGLRWCGTCVSDVLLDYSEDPEGACMVCGTWASHNGPDRLAA